MRCDIEAVRALSEREREVLGHMANGDTYVVIARRLGLSRHTVDTYIRRIRAKTGAASRTELLLCALSLHQRPEGEPAGEDGAAGVP
ncbi:response regulator transcription factor [Streptomyces varsoviensis]|uniref:HTH luxR-type domain-containing protein n=1 Tax=Streptomyces varsoviensis TaxID=67373 RepID=A0ABR5JBX0_9ACTN|nr:helix-turn-helix transcriptional regulator [Streptomyces varsoviensis]KOG90891.1 hypothetical protein ADK38_06160 [Streptomyces varsoviensis]